MRSLECSLTHPAAEAHGKGEERHSWLVSTDLGDQYSESFEAEVEVLNLSNGQLLAATGI